MAKYTINGARQLSGSVKVSGSKNASLPIICATLLTSEQCILHNVPEISDVQTLVKILTGLGAKIQLQDHEMSIDNSALNSSHPDPEAVKKFRASILLAGALLGRFKKVSLALPGGDAIGSRPIDAHLLAFKALGATISGNDVLEIEAPKLVGAKIIMTEMSVTATENAILAAVLAEGATEIHLAAAEPHVQDLCNMLNAMGAKISGIGTHDLSITGVAALHGAEHTIIGDNDVAVSYINLAAATKSEITVAGINPGFINAALIQFQQMQVNLEIGTDYIKVKKPLQAYSAFPIKTNIYPGLMSDQVPPFAVLATQAKGKSLVHEWMYEGRLGYIHELAKMGAKAAIIDQHRAEIEGPCQLHGTNVSSLDIRSGMVVVIAALVAEGTSILHDIEHIERGYEKLVQNLKALGADIERSE